MRQLGWDHFSPSLDFHSTGLLEGTIKLVQCDSLIKWCETLLTKSVASSILKTLFMSTSLTHHSNSNSSTTRKNCCWISLSIRRSRLHSSSLSSQQSIHKRLELCFRWWLRLTSPSLWLELLEQANPWWFKTSYRRWEQTIETPLCLLNSTSPHRRIARARRPISIASCRKSARASMALFKAMQSALSSSMMSTCLKSSSTEPNHLLSSWDSLSTRRATTIGLTSSGSESKSLLSYAQLLHLVVADSRWLLALWDTSRS